MVIVVYINYTALKRSFYDKNRRLCFVKITDNCSRYLTTK